MPFARRRRIDVYLSAAAAHRLFLSAAQDFQRRTGGGAAS
jgi:hypothetical protein